MNWLQLHKYRCATGAEGTWMVPYMRTIVELAQFLFIIYLAQVLFVNRLAQFDSCTQLLNPRLVYFVGGKQSSLPASRPRLLQGPVGKFSSPSFLGTSAQGPLEG
jgi:hypothetical protein